MNADSTTRRRSPALHWRWLGVCLLLCVGATRLMALQEDAPATAAQPAPDDIALLTRFSELAEPFVTANPRDETTWRQADQLADDLPALVEMLARLQHPPSSEWLGHVAVALCEHGTSHLDAVVSQAPALRALLADAGAELGGFLDERLAISLMRAGRLAEAETVLAGGIEAWRDVRPRLLSMRANLHRRLERWQACRQDLAQADAALAERSLDASWPDVVEVRCERAQLELALGRLDVAADSLRAAGQALGHGRHSASDLAYRWLDVSAMLAQTRADLDLTAGRYELVQTGLDAWSAELLEDQERPVSMRAQLALALDSLERHDAGREPRARALLEDLVQAGGLGPAEWLAVSLRLALQRLEAEEYAACGALAGSIERQLEDWSAAQPEATRPLQELATLRTIQSRLDRARGADQATMRGHLTRLSDAYADMLDSWARTPVLPGGLGFLQFGVRREVLSELLGLRAEHDPRGAEGALDDVLAAHALGSWARARQLPAPHLDELRERLLHGGGGALVYLPAVRSGQLLLVDEHDVSLHAIPGTPTLSRLARQAADAAWRSEVPAVQELARALLPEPQRSRLRAWNHVYVVGLSDLKGVRVEALPLERGAGADTLGDSTPLAELPSLPVGVWLARQAVDPVPAARDHVALWVAPEPSAPARARWPELAPIPFGAPERGRLLAPFGGPGEGAEPEWATPTRLDAAPLGEARLLHLLCHGAWDDGAACLALAPDPEAPDGLVSSREVERPARPYPPMVMVSACGAALGPERRGDDGVSHLGGAFLAGGARCVLLADGDLSYRAILELSEIVHAALADGASPAEALRQARAATRSQLPLRLLGLAHVPLFTPRARAAPWWAWAAGAVTLVGLGAWLSSRRAATRR